MDYVISFGDVMAGLIAVGLSALTFFVRSWFNGLSKATNELKKMVKENDEATSRRIDRLEEKHDAAIINLREELNRVEKDFPVVYVQRDDFFRSMNGVETKINNIESKIDRLLMQTQAKP